MPPSYMCNQSFIFKRKLTADPDDVYNDSKFADAISVSHAVVHLRTVYSGTNSNRQIVANGTIVLFKGITEPFIDLDKDSLGSKIIYEGKEYTLTNVNEDKDPTSEEIYQYKLQIV